MRRPSAKGYLVVAMLALVPFGGVAEGLVDRSNDAVVGAAADLSALPPTLPISDSTQGQFTSPCDYSHRFRDDPIVSPGVAGASHSHDFFANTSTNASSTYGSLQAAATRCRRAADTAAYWVPTLYQNGRAVTPLHANVYYLTGGKPGRTIRAFPAGLEIIAGDSKATAAQPRRVVAWSCGAESDIPPSSEVPACPGGSMLRLHIRFPDCWDGSRRDSADHKSHMAYSMRGECPASHRVPTPLLQLNIVYPIEGGWGVTLSSGSAYTAHADFFNAWNQEELERLVRRCLNSGRRCHAGD